ncbi:hypothetical protein DEJ24_00770 [Curtobacterium sp. MCPF17_001]|nr:hypothetical protein DEJ24_00770 [Curtobacterium sp. MCPF17_001]
MLERLPVAARVRVSGFAVAEPLFDAAMDHVRVATPLDFTADEDPYRHTRVVLTLPPIESTDVSTFGIEIRLRSDVPTVLSVLAIVSSSDQGPHHSVPSASGAVITTSRATRVRAPRWGFVQGYRL